ncbi:MAG: hypothetical protein IPJ85_17940 [Flavobacteriales bacterium]|nr:hypothetical protein [Flavobacteriales bacterium]
MTEVKENVEVARELERKAMQNKAAFEQWGGQAQLSRCYRCTLEMGRRDGGIAFCSIVNVVMVNMDMYTGAMQQNSNSTAADRSIMRFPAARRDEAERVLASIQGSYATGPAVGRSGERIPAPKCGMCRIGRIISAWRPWKRRRRPTVVDINNG